MKPIFKAFAAIIAGLALIVGVGFCTSPELMKDEPEVVVEDTIETLQRTEQRNMKQYKVIKDFESLKKGDTFIELEDGNFELTKEVATDTVYYKYSMIVDPSTIETLNEGGFLLDEVAKQDSACCEKLNALNEYIDEMIKTYDEDYDSLMQEYEEGNVQPCVKVEAETVHYNLVKVLKHLKDYINE